MRWVIWLLMIFAAATLAALFGVENQYSVVFYMKENSYQISFNFFVIAAILILVAGYLLARLLANLLNLPSATRRWRDLRRERHGNTELNEAILQYLAGRYSRTVKSANKAIKAYEKNRSRREKIDGTVEFGVVAHLMAAAGANRLKDKETYTEQMNLALKLAEKSRLSDAPDGVRLQQAQWLIENREPQAARAAIGKLDPGVARRIATLQMQLKIDRMEGAPLAALHTARMLIKHKAYEPQKAEQIISDLASQVLDSATDLPQLKDLWEKLDAKERKLPAVIAHAAWKYAQYHDAATACSLIATCWSDINTLPENIRTPLLITLDLAMSGADESWLKRIEQTHNQAPEDPMLTYLAGRVCEQHQILGRAQMLLDQIVRNEQLSAALRQRALLALAKMAEDSNEAEKAAAYYKEAALLFNA
ncbi:heme biosynthesis protein HemY [Saezia sanguinis]|jgi:HemY protein|uniref:heme biosynthesis protein HemY n=1 Tax=Saezia sanguinis TaxID=1965230 RepID=UPI00301F6356